MIKPNAPQTSKRNQLINVARKVARTGLAASAIGGVSAASAEAMTSSTVASLERNTNQQIAEQQAGITTYNGKLSIREKVQGGVIDLKIKHPVVVYTNNPQGDLTNYHGLRDKKHVTYGFISRDNDQPDVVLFPYNHKTMTLTRDPESDTPLQTNVFFSSDGAGGFDWNEPYTSQDGEPLHGGPVLNPEGEPEQIALPSIKVIEGNPHVSL